MPRRMGKRRVLLTCLLIAVGLLLLRPYLYGKIDPSDESFTEIDRCPACYGQNLCPHFFHGHVTLIGGSKLKFMRLLNRKNVYHGRLGPNRVVLKKLAHDWEILEGDHGICTTANMLHCDPSVAISTVVSSVRRTKDAYFTSILKKLHVSADFGACPSERLLSHIHSKMNFVGTDNETAVHVGVAEMMYGIYINPESVILQAFSQNEGWPFPRYEGSCGRVLVEEYVGLSLLNYEDANWKTRLDLSYQLLLIAQQLTDNALGFALYLTDITMDNFAVKSDGTLLLVDVENIVIVDRQKIRKEKNYGWNQLHRSTGKACKDCFSYSYDDLCTHDMSDHNFYAICRGLLVAQAYHSYRGLLHSIPTDIDARTNLTSLVRECAAPSSDVGRFLVVPKLLQVMKSLL